MHSDKTKNTRQVQSKYQTTQNKYESLPTEHKIQPNEYKAAHCEYENTKRGDKTTQPVFSQYNPIRNVSNAPSSIA